MEEVLISFICIQTVLLPIMGGLYLGIRAERIKKEALFHKALYAVRQLRRPYY